VQLAGRHPPRGRPSPAAGRRAGPRTASRARTPTAAGGSCWAMHRPRSAWAVPCAPATWPGLARPNWPRPSGIWRSCAGSGSRRRSPASHRSHAT